MTNHDRNKNAATREITKSGLSIVIVVGTCPGGNGPCQTLSFRNDDGCTWPVASEAIEHAEWLKAQA